MERFMEKYYAFYIIRIHKTLFWSSSPFYNKYYQFMGSKATQPRNQPSLDDLLL